MSNNKENESFVKLEIGSLVEDLSSGELYQIIDKGTNYITVASSNGVKKKWLNEVIESEKDLDTEFKLLENGQISCFGFISKNFNSEFSTILYEQILELNDLYAQHQVIKCLDEALDNGVVYDRRYEVLERVENFFTKNNITVPFVVEYTKHELQTRKLANVFGEALDCLDSTPKQTIDNCLKIVESMNEKQKQIVSPFIKLSNDFGLVTEDVYDRILDLLEVNIDDIEIEIEDINEAFSDEDYDEELLSEEVLNEVLSIQGRQSLARDLKRRSSSITVKRERALGHAANTSQLLARARKLAITMIKRRMFRKPLEQLSRGEKERFEKGSSKRKVLVARLAQKLVGKVRMLQNKRLHPQNNQTNNPSKNKESSGGAS